MVSVRDCHIDNDILANAVSANFSDSIQRLHPTRRIASIVLHHLQNSMASLATLS